MGTIGKFLISQVLKSQLILLKENDHKVTYFLGLKITTNIPKNRSISSGSKCIFFFLNLLKKLQHSLLISLFSERIYLFIIAFFISVKISNFFIFFLFLKIYLLLKCSRSTSKSFCTMQIFGQPWI